MFTSCVIVVDAVKVVSFARLNTDHACVTLGSLWWLFANFMTKIIAFKNQLLVHVANKIMNKYKGGGKDQSKVFKYWSWLRTFCWLVSLISPARNISSTTAYT